MAYDIHGNFCYCVVTLFTYIVTYLQCDMLVKMNETTLIVVFGSFNPLLIPLGYHYIFELHHQPRCVIKVKLDS